MKDTPKGREVVGTAARTISNKEIVILNSRGCAPGKEKVPDCQKIRNSWTGTCGYGG